jgi:hypothetical protein
MALEVAWYDPGSTPCCCGGPTDCCPYPWPDPDGLDVGPLFPAADVITSVEVINSQYNDPGDADGTYTHVPSTYVLQGPTIADPMNPGHTLAFSLRAVYPDDPVTSWVLAVYKSATDSWEWFSSSPCLITSFESGQSWEDPFPDTLMVTPGASWGTEEFPIERLDLCCWEGEGEFENEFPPPETIPDPFKLCYVHLGAETEDEFLGWAMQLADSDAWYVKEGPQNSPVGKYSSMPWPEVPDFSGATFEVAEP